jgi:hypothetical protein
MFRQRARAFPVGATVKDDVTKKPNVDLRLMQRDQFVNRVPILELKLWNFHARWRFQWAFNFQRAA